MKKDLKIVFAGTPEIAKIVLQKILDSGFMVDLVMTKPDSVAHRGKNLVPSVVKELAVTHNIPVITPISLKNDVDTLNKLRELKPDIMIVIAYGLILPQAVLDIPKLGCVNIHVSLLPRFRGAAPIQRAVLAGDKISGITIIKMDSGLDTGDILCQKEVRLEAKETSKSLHDRLAILGAEMIVEYLNNYPQLIPVKQAEAGISYAHKLDKAEARINWDTEALFIDRQVRAFNPFPGAYCEFRYQVIKIWDVDLCAARESRAKPGTIIELSKEQIIVQTKDGCIAINELQLPGKKRMKVIDYLNGLGQSIKVGDVLS